MDERGSLVEKFKKKDEVPILEKGMGELIKQMRGFQQMKAMVMQQFQQKEQALSTMSQQLMQMMPKKPERELQGMNFPEEQGQGQGQGQPDMKIRY